MPTEVAAVADLRLADSRAAARLLAALERALARSDRPPAGTVG
jgi:hypothetical protein